MIERTLQFEYSELFRYCIVNHILCFFIIGIILSTWVMLFTLIHNVICLIFGVANIWRIKSNVKVTFLLQSQEWFNLNHLCSFLFQCHKNCKCKHVFKDLLHLYMYSMYTYRTSVCSCKLSITHILTYTNWQNHTSVGCSITSYIYMLIYTSANICIPLWAMMLEFGFAFTPFLRW